MRLLQYSNTGDFTLTRDLIGDEAIPPYAILSHTWGQNTEVTFGDLINGTGKDKLGYRKIKFCGEQARKDGLEYFWIDTCCIDKSNHVEFQEAINSMFRWYHKAVKCYVYLSDISASDLSTTEDEEIEGFTSITWEAAFLNSRWFTRGWTLQELLAPREVEFYTQDGKRLGDKTTLEQQIHNITGIATPALQGTPLRNFGIKERLLWAEGRRTTRNEDKAYSLLGIFGIYMPLIYGEGEENAFRRLREEIKKLTNIPQQDKNSSSIVGTSTAIIESIIATSTLISSFIRSVREARLDLNLIDNEFQAIKRTLELLREDIDTASGSGVPLTLPGSLEEQLLGIMDCCATTIMQIKDFLGEYSILRAKPDGGPMNWANKAKSDMRSYRTVLESNRRALEIAVDLLSWTMTREAEKKTATIRKDTSPNKEDTARILDEIAKLQEQLPQDLRQPQQQGGVLLDKYLESLTSYTEITDFEMVANWDSDTNNDLSEPEMDVTSKALFKTKRSKPMAKGKRAQLTLRFSSKENYPAAIDVLKRLGFKTPYSRLPKSLLFAVQNRLPRSQLQRPKTEIWEYKQSAPLFVVGAFLFPGTIRRLIKNKTLRQIAQNMTPAVLRGYQRHCVKGRPYPALLPSRDPVVEVTGMLIHDLSDDDRFALHKFQVGMYDLSRITAKIELQDGTEEFCEAATYIWSGPMADLVPLEYASWSPTDMMRDGWLSSILYTVKDEDEAL